jgi:hypothetical protein
LCSFYSTQSQISEIQSQLNFIYNTITQILKANETADTKLNLLESAVYNLSCKNYDSDSIENL